MAGHAHTSPKYEVRAVWLTTIGGLDWPHSYARSAASVRRQQQELCEILDKLQRANVNTVLLQTRVRATTIYPSAIEPWDGCLSGVPGVSPGYDALKFAIDECHKRGMELHAWIVTIPVGKWNGTGCKRLRSKRPSMLHRIGQDGYMNPESPETAGYLARICREVTENYDIDGIHLDYIRYPETWNRRTDSGQGRRNITEIVRQIGHEVKSVKPWVKMSCSPIGKFDDLSRYWSHGWNAYTKVFQDAQGWLRDGLMDELFPMMYFRDNQFYPFALDWKENSYGKIISIGLGIYFLSPKEQNWDIDIIKQEMNMLRRHGLGHAYFRSKFFTDNIKGIYDFAANETDRHPALVPPMTWWSDARPTLPSELHVGRSDSGDELTWSTGRDHSGGPYLTYNIYASENYPVNTDDAGNLIAIRQRSLTLNVPNGNPRRWRNYAVTAVDRYGNESVPACSAAPKSATHPEWMLPNNGTTLTIPSKGKVLDAGYITIETMQGAIIAIKPYTETATDISSLPEGVYVIRSLNKKGITHRLGHFVIRRWGSR